MSNHKELIDLFTADVELDPELAERIVEMPTLGAFIKHPFVNGLYVPGFQHKMYNAQLAYKREAVAQARRRQDWHSYVFLHERPWRFEALQEIAPDMDDEDFWSLTGVVWIDSENIRETYAAWDRLLRIDRAKREYLMDEDERQALARLPQTITVWQGHTVDRDDGWSWTVDKTKAIWFANRFANLEDSEPVLSEGRVHKPKVAAYFTRRNEEEILVSPSDVRLIGSEYL